MYNGKELNSDFGLDWIDYGARYYDPAIARWNAVDPLAEKYYSTSPYAYVLNNPIALIDPNGMEAVKPDPMDRKLRKKRRKARRAQNKRTRKLNRHLKKYGDSIESRDTYVEKNKNKKWFNSGYNNNTNWYGAREITGSKEINREETASSQSVDGSGEETRSHSFLGGGEGTISISFDAFNIPDNVVVSQGDNNVVDSGGAFAGQQSFNASIDLGDGNTLQVSITSPDPSRTVWNYQITVTSTEKLEQERKSEKRKNDSPRKKDQKAYNKKKNN